MNKIYDLIHNRRNWKKHFHLCHFEAIPLDSDYDTFDNDGYIAFTFYFESFFGKIKTATLKLFKVEDKAKSTRDQHLRAALSETKILVAQISEYIKKEPDQYNGKNNIEKLIADAYDCMLLENPLKTSQFIIDFLDCFAPTKEKQDKSRENA